MGRHVPEGGIRPFLAPVQKVQLSGWKCHWGKGGPRIKTICSCPCDDGRFQKRTNRRISVSVKQRYHNGCPNTERGALFCFLRIVRAKTTGHEAGIANAEQVYQSREKYKHRYTKGNRRHHGGISHLMDGEEKRLEELLFSHGCRYDGPGHPYPFGSKTKCPDHIGRDKLLVL